MPRGGALLSIVARGAVEEDGFSSAGNVEQQCVILCECVRGAAGGGANPQPAARQRAAQVHRGRLELAVVFVCYMLIKKHS